MRCDVEHSTEEAGRCIECVCESYKRHRCKSPSGLLKRWYGNVTRASTVCAYQHLGGARGDCSVGSILLDRGNGSFKVLAVIPIDTHSMLVVIPA